MGTNEPIESKVYCCDCRFYDDYRCDHPYNKNTRGFTSHYRYNDKDANTINHDGLCQWYELNWFERLKTWLSGGD